MQLEALDMWRRVLCHGLVLTVVAAQFHEAGRSGVPAMHAALLPNGNVIFLDKLENYTETKLPNGRYAYSSIYNPDDYTLTPVVTRSNAFCCAGAFLESGMLVTVGGNGPLTWLDDSIADGFDAIRHFSYQRPQEGWTEEVAQKLSSRR